MLFSSTNIMVASGGVTVVKQPTHDPKFQGLKPTVANTGREKIGGKFSIFYNSNK